MKLKSVATLVVFCILAFSVIASAQDQKPFNLKELNRFMGDYPDFISYMEEKGKDVEELNRPDAYKGEEMMRLYKAFVEKKGWDLMRFTYMMSHVGSGYAAVRMEEQQPMIQQQMAQAREAIMSNPSFSDEMKQQMVAQMQQGMGQAQTMNEQNKLPESEMNLIRQNKHRLMEVFELQ